MSERDRGKERKSEGAEREREREEEREGGRGELTKAAVGGQVISNANFSIS